MTSGYLLDSQVLMWLGSNQKRVGPSSMRLIRHAELYFSTVSVAELGYKARFGKLQFGPQAIEDWRNLNIRELPFSQAAALMFADFSGHNVPDPMDRQIMATAAANGLGLITSDQRILELGLTWVLDATT
jgi:PIN domain nuclease of toxin-antitoxin system